jgi:hypothetical protein
MMNNDLLRLLRCAAALSTWVFENFDSDIEEEPKFKELDEILKEAAKAAKSLKKSEDGR